MPSRFAATPHAGGGGGFETTSLLNYSSAQNLQM